MPNLIAACRMNHVRTLVHTSTPSVAHRGRIAVEGLDADSAPVATRFKTVYPATKAVAEAAVLAANDAELATVALRPRLIWGPGDNHLLPRLIERVRAGRLRFVGDGMNRIDTTYIDNAVAAHLAAFDHLHGVPDARCAGKAYFISNGEPKSISETINGLLGCADCDSPHAVKGQVKVTAEARKSCHGSSMDYRKMMPGTAQTAGGLFVRSHTFNPNPRQGGPTAVSIIRRAPQEGPMTTR